MIYLIVFWIIFLGLFVVLGINKFLKSEKITKTIEKYTDAYLATLVALLIIAILTNDPIPGLEGLSKDAQWIMSLAGVGIGLWKLYLNPLKQKVFSLDREMGEVKTRVSHLEHNIKEIKNELKEIRATLQNIQNVLGRLEARLTKLEHLKT